MSKIVRPWSDPSDIKLAILETIAEFSRRDDLIGWIQGNEDIKASLTEEIARLAKENASLREQLSKLVTSSVVTFNGLTFQEMEDLLIGVNMDLSEFDDEGKALMQIIAAGMGHESHNLLHYFLLIGDQLQKGGEIGGNEATILASFGLMERTDSEFGQFRLTQAGRQFLLRLKVKLMNDGLEPLSHLAEN